MTDITGTIKQTKTDIAVAVGWDTLLHITDAATGQSARKTLSGFCADNGIDEAAREKMTKVLSIGGSRFGYAYYTHFYDEDPKSYYEVVVADVYDLATAD